MYAKSLFHFTRYSRALREETAAPDPSPVPSPVEPKQLTAKRTQMIVRGNKVLASCKHDGLYYQGSINRDNDSAITIIAASVFYRESVGVPVPQPG